MTTDVTELQNQVREKEKLLNFFMLRSEHLTEQVELLKSRLYGRKSEAHILGHPEDEQLLLFKDAEEPATPDKQEHIKVPAHKRKKTGRKPLPEDLPRIEVVRDIKDKVCDCGNELSTIGEDISEKLDYVPAKIQVIRYIRPKYACKQCEGIDDDTPVKIASVPIQLLPKSNATSGLIAHIAISKFADSLPLYRQEKQFTRLKIDLPRATMCNWLVKTAELLYPLYERFRSQILSGPVINMDETPLQVLKEPGRSNKTKSYMWVFSGGPPDHRVLVYEYHPTRNRDVPKALAKGYKGYVQTDGYRAYDDLGKGICYVGCWAHARRYFADVLKACKKTSKMKKGKAGTAILFIKRLYAVEHEAKDQHFTHDQIYNLRQEKALLILDEFKTWLDENVKRVPPQSVLGKAINYSLNQWERLSNYTKCGYLKPDNNIVENAIRPFVLGRKNWLFAGSPKGAESSSIFFSIIETAKANKLEPYQYLRYILNCIPFCSTDADYDNLLPYNLNADAIADLPHLYV